MKRKLIQRFQQYLICEIWTNESTVIQLNALLTLTCWWRQRVHSSGIKILDVDHGTVLNTCAKFHNFLPKRSRGSPRSDRRIKRVQKIDGWGVLGAAIDFNCSGKQINKKKSYNNNECFAARPPIIIIIILGKATNTMGAFAALLHSKGILTDFDLLSGEAS